MVGGRAVSARGTVWPRALRPWETELGLLGTTARELMSRWLPRLDSGFGRLRRKPHEDGEVDGYGGLTRRGPYDRLLLSELGWLDVAPEEFVRRAAFGEQAFLRIERCQPSERRRMVLLFDAGPSQLGMPRLGQLALLLLAHSQARRQDVHFSWGLIQAPEAVHGTLEESTVKLFGRRGYPTEAHPDQLIESLVAHEVEEGEVDLWVVGSGGLDAATRDWGGRSFVVRESFDPYARNLEVEETGTVVHLASPPGPKALGILRNPLSRPAAVSEIVDAEEGASLLLVGRRSRELVVRNPKGLVATRLQEPHAHPPRPRQLHFEGDLVAVGERSATVHVLVRRGRDFELLAYNNKGELGQTWSLEFETEPVVPGRDVPPAFLFNVGKRRRTFLFADMVGTLRRFQLGEDGISTLEEDVLYVGHKSGGPWVVRRAGEYELELVYHRGNHRSVQPSFDAGAAGVRPLVGPRGGVFESSAVFLYSSLEGPWRVFGLHGAPRDCTWPDRPGSEVIGAFALRNPENETLRILLVRLDADRRRLFLELPNGLVQREIKLEKEVVSAQLSPQPTAWLLLRHRNGLSVLSLPSGEKVRLR